MTPVSKSQSMCSRFMQYAPVCLAGVAAVADAIFGYTSDCLGSKCLLFGAGALLHKFTQDKGTPQLAALNKKVDTLVTKTQISQMKEQLTELMQQEKARLDWVDRAGDILNARDKSYQEVSKELRMLLGTTQNFLNQEMMLSALTETQTLLKKHVLSLESERRAERASLKRLNAESKEQAPETPGKGGLEIKSSEARLRDLTQKTRAAQIRLLGMTRLLERLTSKDEGESKSSS